MSKRSLTSGEVAAAFGWAVRTATAAIDDRLLRGYRLPNSKDRRVPIAECLRYAREHGLYDAVPRLERLAQDAGVAVNPIPVVLLVSPDSRELLPHLVAAGFDASQALTALHAGGLLWQRAFDAAVLDSATGSAEAAENAAVLRARFPAMTLAVLAGEDHDPGRWRGRFDLVWQQPIDGRRVAFSLWGHFRGHGKTT